MPISVVFNPPLPSDAPGVFNTKAFTLLGDLNTLSTQVNAEVSGVNAASATATTGASTATTQAGIATTQAGNAATSASTATAQAGNAATSASTATTQAGNAATSAGNASTSASNAASSASTVASAITTERTATATLTNKTLTSPVITGSGAITAGAGSFTTVSASGATTLGAGLAVTGDASLYKTSTPTFKLTDATLGAGYGGVIKGYGVGGSGGFLGLGVLDGGIATYGITIAQQCTSVTVSAPLIATSGLAVTGEVSATGGVRVNALSNVSTLTNVSQSTGIALAGNIPNTSEAALSFTSGGGGSAISFARGTSWDTSLKFYANASTNSVGGGMALRAVIDYTGLAVTGGVSASTRFDAPSFTVATLPAAGAAGGLIFVSNAGGNGPCHAVSNGSVWKRSDNTSTTVV